MTLRRSLRTTKGRSSRQGASDTSNISATIETNQPETLPRNLRNDDARTLEDSDVSGPKQNNQQVTMNPRKRRRIDIRNPGTTPSKPLDMISAPYSSGDIDDATPPPEYHKAYIRHAQASTTEAPLRTSDEKLFGPSQTTTPNLLHRAKAHLIEVDPCLRHIVDKHHCHVFSEEGLGEEIDPFRSLVSGIMAQQVSGAAAKSIKAKFVALFNEDENGSHRFPFPAEVASTDIPRLRLAGLSQRKAEYVKGLAAKFASGELTTEMLGEASDEEIMAKLTAVRGLGVWSVEMFACFALKRMDILSTGDLGVQRGMAAYVRRDIAKLKAKGGGKWKYMSEKEMLEVSEKFRPYRSLLMWYMWRIEANGVDVTAMQDNTTY
ncbi:MAG: 3-methyladenine DNA glycosylase [Chrysothrix sp. TS-e1954]|nr:MAG: 3-methyladenine DNA glycosylase [Chrysothrix sp. TS-e1954]